MEGTIVKEQTPEEITSQESDPQEAAPKPRRRFKRLLTVLALCVAATVAPAISQQVAPPPFVTYSIYYYPAPGIVGVSNAFASSERVVEKGLQAKFGTTTRFETDPDLYVWNAIVSWVLIVLACLSWAGLWAFAAWTVFKMAWNFVANVLDSAIKGIRDLIAYTKERHSRRFAPPYERYVAPWVGSLKHRRTQVKDKQLKQLLQSIVTDTEHYFATHSPTMRKEYQDHAKRLRKLINLLDEYLYSLNNDERYSPNKDSLIRHTIQAAKGLAEYTLQMIRTANRSYTQQVIEQSLTLIYLNGDDPVDGIMPAPQATPSTPRGERAAA